MKKELGNFLFLKRALRETFFRRQKISSEIFFKVWLKNFKFLTQTFLCRSICSRYFRLQIGGESSKIKIKFLPFSWMAHEKGIGEFFIFKASSSRNFFAAKNFIRNFFKVWLKISNFWHKLSFAAQFVVDIFDYNWRKSEEILIRLSIPFHEWPMKKELGNFYFKASSSRNFFRRQKKFHQKFF